MAPIPSEHAGGHRKGGAHAAEAGGRRGGGTRPAGAGGRKEVGGGTVVTVFSNGPEPRVPKDCLTVGVIGGPVEAMFFNGPDTRVPRDCLRIVSHPSV